MTELREKLEALEQTMSSQHYGSASYRCQPVCIHAVNVHPALRCHQCQTLTTGEASLFLITCCVRSTREGYVLTCVCSSVCPQARMGEGIQGTSTPRSGQDGGGPPEVRMGGTPAGGYLGGTWST